MPTKKTAEDGFRSAEDRKVFTRNAVITGVGVFAMQYIVPFAVLIPALLSMPPNEPGQTPKPPNLMFVAGMGMFYLMMLVVPFILAFVLQGQIDEHRYPSGAVNGKEVTYATLWQRGWAVVLNMLVILVPLGAIAVIAMIAAFIMKKSDGMDGVWGWVLGLGMFVALLYCVGMGIYLIYMDGSTGQTFGRRWMNIRMLGTDMKPCGFWRTVLRGLAGIVDGFFQYLCGTLIIGFSRHQQRLGDLAADTIVIQVPASKK